MAIFHMNSNENVVNGCNEFKINLLTFHGPLDLLHYLIRKNELDILAISLTMVTDQFLEYLAILEELDVNAVGDFLVVACALVELKSFQVLPNCEEIEEEIEDPRQDLVKQLLAYKEHSDGAVLLEKQSRNWQQHYPRVVNELPTRSKNLAEEEIREVELWDLVSAFGRIVRDNAPKAKHEIIYDDTPISTHMKRIYFRLKQEEHLSFRSLFTAGQHRSTLIGIFLAVLELVRHEYAHVHQGELFGEIEITYRQGSKSLDFADIGDYSSIAA